jgi:L-asparaginase
MYRYPQPLRLLFKVALSLALGSGGVGMSFPSAVAQLPAAPTSAAPTTTARRANIVILATGGTIAGTGATSTTIIGYQAAKLPVQKLIAAVPELRQLANVTGEQVLQIASQDITNENLLTLGQRVNQLLAQPQVDGIVITHGTDTLEETAYFLNLVVKSSKPVVVVGSMRPATALSADGPLNLYDAVALAGSPAAIGKGTLVMLNDQISAAREVTKTNTTSTNTFQSPDLGYLGYVELGQAYFYRQPVRPHTAATEFDISGLKTLPQVDILYGYGNSSRALVDAAVGQGVKGLIYAGVGNGNFAKPVIPAIAAATGRGVVVVRSARTGAGRVARNAEMPDDQLGTVAADNLNPQKARILLMLALTKTANPQAIQQMFDRY